MEYIHLNPVKRGLVHRSISPLYFTTAGNLSTISPEGAKENSPGCKPWENVRPLSPEPRRGDRIWANLAASFAPTGAPGEKNRKTFPFSQGLRPGLFSFVPPGQRAARGTCVVNQNLHAIALKGISMSTRCQQTNGIMLDLPQDSVRKTQVKRGWMTNRKLRFDVQSRFGSFQTWSPSCLHGFEIHLPTPKTGRST